ncbi:MAG: hypothetical protein LBK59_04940, partial [Bifidobacteriaceae bacterium]|nr:hypothetical protein [Bifidobacteriaceae bacterium]
AGTNVLASLSGVSIPGYELVREDVEAPIRNDTVTTTRPDPDVLRELFAYESAIGAVIGEETIRVMSTTTQRDSDPVLWGARDTVTCPGRIRLDNAREGVPGEFTYDGAPDVPMRTGVLGIGDVVIAQVNAEIYVKIGLRMKEQSPFTKTMVVTVANGKANSSYVLDYQSEYHETFQALNSKLKPGCAEGALADSVTQMAAEYASTSTAAPAPAGPAIDPAVLDELQSALDDTRQALATSHATDAEYRSAIAQLTAAVGSLKTDISAIDSKVQAQVPAQPAPTPPAAVPPPAAKATTSSIAVKGATFSQKTKPKVAVTIKVTGGKVGGKVALYVAGKKVKTVAVASAKTAVTLPSKYSKSIKVKAVYSPSTDANGTAKSSTTAVVKAKKK